MHRIVSRNEWNAKYGRGADVSSRLPWGEVVVHTEAGAVRPGDWPAVTAAAKVMSLTEKQHIQAIERYHSATLGWQGVGYSFLISRDGTIFEGRGWGRSGAHTETRNSTALGVCFLGHGDVQPATEAQWSAARWLIAEGIRLGHLTLNPKISGHRNYSKKGKTCPGNLIYPHIQTRLAGITGNKPVDPPAPIVPEDWFTMATKEDLESIIDHRTLPELVRGPDKRIWIFSPATATLIPFFHDKTSEYRASAVDTMVFTGRIKRPTGSGKNWGDKITSVPQNFIDAFPVVG